MSSGCCRFAYGRNEIFKKEHMKLVLIMQNAIDICGEISAEAECFH